MIPRRLRLTAGVIPRTSRQTPLRLGLNLLLRHPTPAPNVRQMCLNSRRNSLRIPNAAGLLCSYHQLRSLAVRVTSRAPPLILMQRSLLVIVGVTPRRK